MSVPVTKTLRTRGKYRVFRINTTAHRGDTVPPVRIGKTNGELATHQIVYTVGKVYVCAAQILSCVIREVEGD